MTSVLAALFACVVIAPALSESAPQAGPGGPAPEVLYWRDSAGKPVRATGLLYRPELLSVLIADRARESVPTRVLQAIEQQTPIVVMWAVPAGLPDARVSRPFHMLIRDKTTGNSVAPLWENQDAADMRVIDPRTPFEDIGTMAAFPRSAFQPGRIAVIYAPLPDDPVTGAHRLSQVFGEFQETRALAK